MYPSVDSRMPVAKGQSLPPLSVMMGQQRPVSPVSSTASSPTSTAAELHKILPKTDKCTCKADGNHIPRPRNAFILFRQKNHQALLEEGSVIKTNPDVSRELGKRWRNLSPEEKAFWNKKAEEEKKKHAEKYPGYKYTPRRAMKKSCVVCRARNAIKNHNLSVQYYQQQQQAQQQQYYQQQQAQQQQQQQQQQQYWEYQIRASSSSPQGYLPSPQQSSTGSVSSVSSTSSSYAPMKNYTTSLPFPTYSIPNGQALQPPHLAGQLPPPQIVLPRQHQQSQPQQPLMHHRHNQQSMVLPPISNLSLPPLHMNLVPRNINETR